MGFWNSAAVWKIVEIRQHQWRMWSNVVPQKSPGQLLTIRQTFATIVLFLKNMSIPKIFRQILNVRIMYTAIRILTIQSLQKRD